MGPQPATRRGLPAVLAPLTIGAVVLTQQVVLLLAWFRHVTNEDFALLWAAARSWGHLSPHQPNFWGQTYGTTFEAVPTELLRWVGVGYPTGLPLVILVAHLATWWLPAAVAWRRGHRVLACLAIAAPMLLSTEYVISASVYSVVAGRVLAGVCAAIVVAGADERAPVAWACGLGALAFLFDASSALLAAPAVAYALVTRARVSRSRARDAATIAVALVPAAAWWTLTSWWYDRHPAENLHPAPTLTPSLHLLGDNLAHPGRLFGRFAPELLRVPALVLVVVAVVVVRAVAGRRPPVVAAALVFLGAALFAAAIPKSTDELPTVYFLATRTVLALPIGLWFLLVVGPPLRWSRRASSAALAAAVAVTVVTGLVRAVTWDDRGAPLQRQAERAATYPLTPTTRIEHLCARVGRAARRSGARVAVFSERTRAYACAGLLDDAVTTVFPEYERRAWVLLAVDRPQGARMLVVGRIPDACRNGSVPCRTVGKDIAVVELGGRSPLAVARALGYSVRSF
ncbi:MAG: hypothetical protein ACXVJ7_11820 [Acidimicrobiia bacterium]